MREHHSLQTYYLLSNKTDRKGRTLPEDVLLQAKPDHHIWRERAAASLKALADLYTPDYAYAVQDAVRAVDGWTWKRLFEAGKAALEAAEKSKNAGIDDLLGAAALEAVGKNPDANYWTCKAAEALGDLAGVIGNDPKDIWLDLIEYQERSWKAIYELAVQETERICHE